MRGSVPLVHWIAAAVIIALVAACGGAGDDAADDQLPAVELLALDGAGPLSLDTPTDAPRVINLWATWCAPCRSELPAFDEVATAAGGSIEMLGVNVGEGADAAGALIDELDIGFPQAVNPTGDITSALGIAGLPATIFASADGEILEVHGGALDAAQLTDRIEDVLGVTIDA